MRKAAWLVLLTLAACGERGPAIADLRLAQGGYPGLSQVQTRSFYERGRGEDGGPAPAAITRAMQAGGIEAAAQYRYTIVRGETSTVLRARVELYGDAAEARGQFRGRHMPEALAETETLQGLGDDAFAYRDEYLGFVTGRVIVEIRAKPPHPVLRDFAAHYAAFIGDKTGS